MVYLSLAKVVKKMRLCKKKVKKMWWVIGFPRQYFGNLIVILQLGQQRCHN